MPFYLAVARMKTECMIVRKRNSPTCELQIPVTITNMNKKLNFKEAFKQNWKRATLKYEGALE